QTGIRIFVSPYGDGADAIQVSWGGQPSGIYVRNPFENSSFVPVPGALAQISAENSDNIWGLNNQDQIFYYDWNIRRFIQVPGSLTQIVAAGNTAWGLNAEHDIFRFNRQTWRFEQIPGKLVQIVAGGVNQAWGINQDFEIFRFNGSTERFENI